MARKSRKQAAVPVEMQPALEDRIYRTALYVRLSILDTRDRPDSESLANQQYLLEDYAAQRPFLQIVRVFTDNGETGTDFHRPAWNELMAECRAGRIDCIVVKDLSRLGRNYLETGEYLEMVLPAIGVRFIAVNDNYDSLTLTDSNRLVFGLKNLVNDIYAKDISRKSSSALRQKQKSGAFIGSYAAYGYMKTPEDKNKIVVDTETAPVVRQIFRWKAEGVSTTLICRRLNESGISAPCKYRLEKGILKNERYARAEWAPATIKSILRNPVYLGHMAQGKQGGALYEGKERKRAASSEWVVVENTHEPIIEQALFDRAQEVLDERKAAYDANLGRYSRFERPENIFKGLVYCADCGRPLYRYKSVTGNGKYVSWVFQCRTHTLFLDACCPKKYIHEDALAELVHYSLLAEIGKAADMERVIAKLSQGAEHKRSVSWQETEIESLYARLRRVTGLRQAAYEDYSTGLLTMRDYQFAVSRYEAEIENLNQRIAEAEKIKAHLTQSCTPANKYLSAFRRISDQRELDAELLTILVDRIIVSGDNTVDVIWKFRDEYKALLQYMGDVEKAVG